MFPNEHQIQKIVEEVVKKMNVSPGAAVAAVPAASFSSGGQLGVFNGIDEAIKAAALAYRELRKLNLQKREEMISAMREISIKNVESLAREAVEETKMGRVADKVQKILLAAKKTPGTEDLVQRVKSGDHGLTLEERGPYGVIASVTPSTNPVATVINNSISMIAAGNAVVYNFHPSAKKVCARTLSLLNEAIVTVGGPKNLLTCTGNPTMESSNALMKHPDIRLVCVTGGPNVVKAAFECGKKVIAAGPGNPPVVIDETADLDQAARDTVDGASFDNNVMCIAEKECYIVNSVFDKVREKMKQHGAFEIKGEEINKLMKVVFDENGQVNRKWVGRDAKVILREIGIHVSDDIKLIIAEVDQNHLLVEEEMLMPVLPLVRVKDVDEAIELAVEAEHGFFHTAMMHSHNIANLHKMAVAINTTIFVKNGPSYSGLGFNGEGHTTLTIAGPTGEGVTSARTFTRERRCVLIDYFRIV